jgi:hypothetical protein
MVWKMVCMIWTYELATGTLRINWTAKVTTGLQLQLCSKEIMKNENYGNILTYQVMVTDKEKYFYAFRFKITNKCSRVM